MAQAGGTHLDPQRAILVPDSANHGELRGPAPGSFAPDRGLEGAASGGIACPGRSAARAGGEWCAADRDRYAHRLREGPGSAVHRFAGARAARVRDTRAPLSAGVSRNEQSSGAGHAATLSAAVLDQYRFAIGNSSAGNSVITRQPLSVTTTSSSMRAAE